MTRTSASLGPGSGTGISSMRKSVSAGSPGGRRARTTRRQVFGVILVPPLGYPSLAQILAPPSPRVEGRAGRGGSTDHRLRDRGGCRPFCGAAPAARHLAAGRGRIFVAGTPAKLRPGTGTRRLAFPRFGNRALGAPPVHGLLALPRGPCNFRLWRRRGADFALDLTRIAQPGLEIARRGL